MNPVSTLAVWGGFMSACFVALFAFSHALPTAAHDAQTSFWNADGTAHLMEARK